jgi:galactokinase
MNKTLYDRAGREFIEHFGRPHAAAAYAPGRVEVLGNHTDYNEGYVLSAAINFGIFFLVSPSHDNACRIAAPDVDDETSFPLSNIRPSTEKPWVNYVKGVLAKLKDHGTIEKGFDGLVTGDIPLSAGLSSSAALEMAAGLSLCSLYGLTVDPLALARIGQAAEHEFAGARTGLLDQITSLFGRAGELVVSDFRSLEVDTVPLGKDACFLVCNTNVRRALVEVDTVPLGKDACFLVCNTNVRRALADGEYNTRRERCEEAARFFETVLGHPVTALRDVNWSEWKEHSRKMDPVAARRAAHIIGENARVLRGRDLLRDRDLHAFGRLMFESHGSSIENFENSCRELDFLVAQARRLPGVLGGRLSGGGFGGSAVLLLHPRDTDVIAKALCSAYGKEFGCPCDVHTIAPSAGAEVIQTRSPGGDASPP